MAIFNRSFLLVATGFVAGAAAFSAGFVFASPRTMSTKPSHHAYEVSMDEIRSRLLPPEQFSGEFTRKVTTSDGSIHEVTLQPVRKNGQELVELIDKSSQGTRRSYMGPNATAVDGSLMINVKDVMQAKAEMQKLSRREAL